MIDQALAFVIFSFGFMILAVAFKILFND